MALCWIDLNWFLINCRIGSDEDDESEDETRESEDPSDTAVSRSAIHDHLMPNAAQDSKSDEENSKGDKDQVEEKEKNEEDEDEEIEEIIEAEGDSEEDEQSHSESAPTSTHMNGEV